MYRYTGNSPAALIIDGVGFPVDPQRIYNDGDFVVQSRPDQFIRQAGGSEDTRVSQLEAANAALESTVAELTADLDEHLAFAAEVLAGADILPQNATPVEAASSAPGEKRTVARRAR